MSEIVKFPGAEPPSQSNSADEEDDIRDPNEVHVEAFRDLEVEVCDLEHMGQIAQDYILRCVAREDGRRNLDLSTFALMQLAKMLREFKERYYKRWHGDPLDEL